MAYVIAFDLLQMYAKVFVSFCNNFFAMQFFTSLQLTSCNRWISCMHDKVMTKTSNSWEILFITAIYLLTVGRKFEIL